MAAAAELNEMAVPSSHRLTERWHNDNAFELAFLHSVWKKNDIDNTDKKMRPLQGTQCSDF